MRLQIADLPIDIRCEDSTADRFPNWQPFVVSSSSGEPALCCLETGVCLSPETAEPTLVNRLEERILRLWLMPDHCTVSLTFHEDRRTYWLRADRRWQQVCTDWTPASPRSYMALDDFLMITYIYSSAFRHTVLIHASCIAVNDAGCAFIGPSGVGKSTHSRLWLEHIPGSRLLNDDQPVLRLLPDGSVRVYGSPWSGKTPCYRNEGARLNALFFMEQATENQAVRLDGIRAFCRLLEAVSAIGRDARTFAPISETLAEIVGTVPAYLLRNLPEKSAALLSAKLCFDARDKVNDKW